MLEQIQYQDKTICLIGSAHISRESVEEVEKTIREIQPDAVCVELCAARLDSIENPEKWNRMDIVKVIKEGKLGMLFFNMLLASYQRKLGKQVGVKPGSEIKKAISVAEELGAKLVLADRDVGVTLKRITGKLSFWAKSKLFSELFASFFSREKINENDLREMLQKDVVSSMVEELGQAHPVLRRVLIDERDSYLAEKIRSAPGKTVVAVVGAGHMQGILDKIESEIDTDALIRVENKTSSLTLLKWVVPALLIAMIAAGFHLGGAELGKDIVLAWVLVNGVPSALGAILAGAHWGTVLTAFFASPLTSLNPALGVGTVAALAEAWIKKPKVVDFEEVLDSFESFSKLRKNGITRIFLIMLLTTVGSIAGTFIGASYIFNLVQ